MLYAAFILAVVAYPAAKLVRLASGIIRVL